MTYRDLRDFLAQLEPRGELKRVRAPVDPRLEMTELCDRVLKAGGPALLFEQPTGDFARHRAHDSGARQPVRHAAARRARDGRRRRRLARERCATSAGCSRF